VGLINADAWCETRSGTLSELEHWGIETVFSIAITAAEHTPELADNIFVWPNCIDPDVYKDYQEHKVIPILLSGANAALYPWRQRVHELLAARYPSLSCPHPGYLARPAAGSSMYGERYARTLNASSIAPVCGTVAKELVRKHFEIPACNTLMVAEKSPGLLAAGFIDMQNCVFAGEKDVLDKVAHLFEHPDELAAIARAGYDLVHRCHTMKQRDQLFQWYKLHETLQASHKIIQPGAFEPLTVVSCDSNAKNRHIISNGSHLSLLRQGDDKLGEGRYEEAEAAYSACLAYMRRFPEALLKRALCNLYQGNAELAAAVTFELVQYSLDEYKAPDPDPVEWAYYIVALLGLGKVREASKRANEFPRLRHSELNRVRWATQVLQSGVNYTYSTLDDEVSRSRPSIHRLPKRPMKEWIVEMRKILVACRQSLLATKLAIVSTSAVSRRQNGSENIRHTTAFISPTAGFDVSASESLLCLAKQVMPEPFRLRLAYYKLKRRIRRIRTLLLRRVEPKSEGLLTPAAWRTETPEFRKALAQLIRKESVDTALIVGAGSANSNTALAVIKALQGRNASVGMSVRAVRDSHRLECDLGGGTSVWRFGSGTSLRSTVDEDNGTGRTEGGDGQGSGVDMLLIRGSEPRVSLGDLTKIIQATRFVALEFTSNMYEKELFRYLLNDQKHVLVVMQRGVDGGYAIFRNKIVCNARVRHVLPRASIATESDRNAQIES
jgi:tetratricopeptide (TPR) repeat protein